jgi:hypothetical protein
LYAESSEKESDKCFKGNISIVFKVTGGWGDGRTRDGCQEEGAVE